MSYQPPAELKRRAAIRLIARPLRARPRKVAEPLKRGIFLVPAIITSLGLLAGFYSLISAITGHFERAAAMIALAFVCDGLDGRIARASRTSSHFGVEYDSLSDLVAFGVAPAALVYTWALRPLAAWGWIVAGMYVVCAALRLARFNVEAASADKRRFVGLPVPGAAAVIAALVLASSYFEIDSPLALCVAANVLTAALAGLMISRVPYPSFKSIDLHHRAPLELIVVVLIAVAFAVAMPQLSAFLLATAYMLSGPYLMLRGERAVKPPAPLRQAEAGSAREVKPDQHGPAA